MNPLDFDEYKLIKDNIEILNKKNLKFIKNNNYKKCPYMPVEPIFIKLNIGKKSAPYSKGNLWRKQERYNIEAVSKKSKINFF